MFITVSKKYEITVCEALGCYCSVSKDSVLLGCDNVNGCAVYEFIDSILFCYSE
jgi:hypothetical protein